MRYFLLLFAIFCFLSSSFAAQLIIASYSTTTDNIVVSNGDVLAPITPAACHLLGYKMQENGTKITITSNADSKRVMVLNIGSKDATVNSVKSTLKAAPVKKNNELLLPMIALSSFMNVEYIENTKDSIYQLLPTISAAHSSYNSKDIITIISSVPIDYKFGVLDGPHRVYVDLYGTAIGKSTSANIKGNSAHTLRTNQFSVSPSISRVVADLNEECVPTFRFENNNCKLIVTLTPKIPTELKGFSLDIDDTKEFTVFKIEMNKPISPNMTKTGDKLIIPLNVTLSDTQITAVKKLSSEQIKNIDVNNDKTALELTLNKDIGYVITSAATDTNFMIRLLKGVTVAGDTPIPIVMPKKISDAVVVIDAGHGGSDSGAVGQNKTYEKNVNLDVALRVQKLLKEKGVNVIMTRETDKALVLKTRVDPGNNSGAHLFVSIHCNSCATPNTANGTETYYYTDFSKNFAEVMHTNVIDQLKRVDRKTLKGNFLVIRESAMPSVLVEMAYINHSAEEKLLNDADFKQKAAVGICNGIIAYLKSCGAE